jgi:tRNA modification GTPase
VRTEDTIAAIASPPGWGLRAIVRLSGSAAHGAVASIADGALPPTGPARVRLRIDASRTLPTLCLCARSPRSFTGEDTAELLIPGNPLLAGRVLSMLLVCPGVRAAGPGEFTARAYLAGKLTLAQAEGVAATIAAERDADLAAARSLRAGAVGRAAAERADLLAGLLALVEAGIDFTDQEDVVAIAPADLHARLGELRAALVGTLGGPAAAEHAARTPRVVLLGPPNAGKSTLFNALLGRPRALVSPFAGTTRDALEEPLDLSADAPGAGAVTLIDLAGLTERASDAVDAAAQRLAREHVRRADAAVLCDPDARFAEAAALPASMPTVRVRTKADRPGVRASSDALPVCAIDGRHLGVLRRAIADAAVAPGDTGLLPRHRRAFVCAVTAIDGALGAIDPAQRTLADPELVATALRAALDHLGEVAGRLSPDDILGRVFATFCIGK